MEVSQENVSKAKTLYEQAAHEYSFGVSHSAESLFLKVIALCDEDGEVAALDIYKRAHYNIGVICLERGSEYEAVKHFETALQLGVEKNSLICHTLGCFYQIDGDNKQSAEFLREAIRLNENDFIARHFFILACFELSQDGNRSKLIQEAAEHNEILKKKAPSWAFDTE